MEDEEVDEARKNWKDITPEDQRKLKAFYYNDRNLFGRDRLWYSYRKAHPESKISQRTVLAWLKQQELWQKITPPARKGSMRPILSSKPGQYQIDTIDLSTVSYNGFRYVVSAVDILTKRLFSKALKEQTQDTVVEFLDEMKSMDDIVVEGFVSDNGAPFQGKTQAWATENGVSWRFGRPGRPETQGQVEKIQHSIKKMLYASMRLGERNWPEMLPKIVSNINNTMSFATKKSPMEVQMAENKQEIYEFIKAKKGKSRKGFVPKFEAGDKVRLLIPPESSDIRRRAKSGYFGSDIYEIVSRSPSVYAGYVDSYKLKNPETGQNLKGLFPATSLRLVPEGTQPIQGQDEPGANEEGEYEIDSLIDRRELRRARGPQVQYLVLWRGYERNQATWENREDLLINARQLVEEYDRSH